MLIDGFTVIVQIINFLVLVALLKFFLYGPILGAMDARERKIAARLEAAKAEEREAKKQASAFRKKNEDWAQQQESLFAKAAQTADAQKTKMIQEAHAEVDGLRAKWQTSMEQQKKAFLEDLRHRVIHQVYATARRVLHDLANQDLETQMFSALMTHLEGMSGKEWKSFIEGMTDQNAKIIIESVFELSATQRAQITKLMHDHLSEDIHLVFETCADSICGITIRPPGKKMAWHLDDYLTALETEIKKAVESAQGVKRRGKHKPVMKHHDTLES